MRDAGLQPERTALAWRRTAMALFVNGALITRSGLHQGRETISAVGVAVIGMSCLLTCFSVWRTRQLSDASHDPAMLHQTVAALTAAAAAAACVAAMWILTDQ